MNKLRLMSFSSGSCGNCYFLDVEGAGGGVLIDAGASLRRIKQELFRHGLGFDDIKAVLITHDHLDHIRHLGSFCKKLGKPVFAAAPLHAALAEHSFTKDYIASCRRILESGKWNDVAGMQVRYFEVPHDASFTCGFAISAVGRKFVIMTDAGRVTDEAVSLMRQAEVVVIESNYDARMLREGPYPPELQKRISDGHGHISNDECADAIRTFFHDGLKAIFLCHLSENNNTPEAAFASASRAVASTSSTPVLLKPLPRTYPSPLYEL